MENSSFNGHRHHHPEYFSNEMSCLTNFDQDQDGKLSQGEFTELTRKLFCNGQNEAYQLNEAHLESMFRTFSNGADFIDAPQFAVCWGNWIDKILHPISAFLVVDVQNDFISGSLALSKAGAGEDGLEVVEPINQLVDTVKFHNVFFTKDWHPLTHISFVDNVGLRPFHESSKIQDAANAKLFDVVVFEGDPPMEQILWPKHAVQDTWGAELHEKLKIPEGSFFIHKGTNPNVDSYSAFWDNAKLSQTNLNSELTAKGVTDVYICGLAYDICVGQSALDAVELGYRVALIEDASRTLDSKKKEFIKSKLIGAHGVNVQASSVKAMVDGYDRRPELGYKLALELMKHIP